MHVEQLGMEELAEKTEVWTGGEHCNWWGFGGTRRIN